MLIDYIILLYQGCFLGKRGGLTKKADFPKPKNKKDRKNINFPKSIQKLPKNMNFKKA